MALRLDRVTHSWRELVLSAAALLLSGCFSARMVSEYDSQMDAGLTQIYSETTAFMDRMIAAKGTPAGSYDQNKDFYTTEEAKLDALIVRAEAHKAFNDCPSAQAVKKAVQIAAPASPAVNSAVDQIPTGDCEVILLSLTKGAFQDFATFHKSQAGGIDSAARPIILDGGVGSLLRAGITIQVAKKAAEKREIK